MLISKTRRIMYNKTKYKEKKWMNCLQCFSSEEILTNYWKVCLKISGKQSLNMPEECSNVQSNNEIYSDFESEFLIDKQDACNFS